MILNGNNNSGILDDRPFTQQGKRQINPVVFYTSAGLILLFSLTRFVFATSRPWLAARWTGFLKPSVGTINWRQRSILSLWSVLLFAFWFGEALARTMQTGVRLLSWAAMLFAAGIGLT
ncbi:hypothetical protein ACLK1S_01980 [Escherichia coli]